MLEDSVPVMEKKGAPRQSSNSSKPSTAIERKNDPGNSAKYHGRNSRRRDNGSGRGTPPFDFSNRKPIPQKTRSTLDKRPRQRGCYGGRQREEVAGVETQPVVGHLQKGDGRHLLNFIFADREHVPFRRYRPKSYGNKTFSTERYLQANCQFVVKDSGDYSVQACDPDALVSWDLVEQVRTFSYGQTTCPICLHPPSAGQMTRCGHVYCWACMLHYLSLEEEDKGIRNCPICEQDVTKSDLRSVKVVEKQEHKVGDVITLKLMKRARDSTYTVPIAHWVDREGLPQQIHDELSTEYAKVLVASAAEIQKTVIEEEREALLIQLALAEESEICFIETALLALSEREERLLGSSQASKENALLMERLAAGRDEDGGSREKDSKDPGTNAKAASPPLPLVSRPLPKDVSFDGSKIRKQYADAFDELEDSEEEEEEERSLGEELSEHEEEEDWTDSLVTSLSLPDQCQSLPFMMPPGAQGQVFHEEDPQSVLSDDSLSAIAPGRRGEDDNNTMSTEEAVEQLAMPAELEGAASANTSSSSTPPQRGGGPNQSKRYFYFYQASDGQHIYLQSINARCIEHQYDGLENGPHTITARIIDKDILFMKEELRKRVRYLSHVPNACEFQVVEVQLKPPTVSYNTLRHFQGELKKRVQLRQKVKSEDRRMARKQNIQEKMSYGIYPEVKLALDSPDQFPAPAPEVSQRHRNPSLTDVTAMTTSTLTAASPELNANAVEFVPSARPDRNPANTSSPFSFAAALKKVKQQPAPSAWGPTAAQSPAAVAAATAALATRRVDSDESDNEDRVPVPVFSSSFSSAISAKLDTLTGGSKEEGGSEASSSGGKKKKKKKKEKVLLFSTDMMRR